MVAMIPFLVVFSCTCFPGSETGTRPSPSPRSRGRAPALPPAPPRRGPRGRRTTTGRDRLPQSLNGANRFCVLAERKGPAVFAHCNALKHKRNINFVNPIYVVGYGPSKVPIAYGQNLLYF